MKTIRSSTLILFPCEQNLKRSTFQYSLIKHKLKNILDIYEGIVEWKNIDSTFLGCNHHLALSANLKNPNDIIGKNDEDFPWGKDGYASVFRQEDKLVLSGLLSFTFGCYNYADKKKLF